MKYKFIPRFKLINCCRIDTTKMPVIDRHSLIKYKKYQKLFICMHTCTYIHGNFINSHIKKKTKNKIFLRDTFCSPIP